MTSTDPDQQAAGLRAELAATLAAIEEKVNVPKRVKRNFQRLSRENPVVLAAIGLAAVAAVGGAAWGVVSLLRKR